MAVGSRSHKSINDADTTTKLYKAQPTKARHVFKSRFLPSSSASSIHSNLVRKTREPKPH
ncbi:hypothetical protein L484_016587 [Morus notabilis]|uniref:Uncharacterized protein n=1 Tax=Morus notabilis TaxID=981085 RepID=W9QL50_9ROSA|nr:hypothetical protein L484_016587 [Morus notabilis]